MPILTQISEIKILSRTGLLFWALICVSVVLLFLVFASRLNALPDISRTPPAAIDATGPIANEKYIWKPVAIGGGGFVTGIDMDPTGKTRVVRTDVHGAYIWNAKNDKWDLLTTAGSLPLEDRKQNGFNQGVYEITVAPSRPQRLYMAAIGTVFRSDDGGQNWQRPSTLTRDPIKFDANGPYRHYGPFLAVDPENPDLVLFGTAENGLWRSEDGGMNWQSVSSVPVIKDLQPQPGIQGPGIMIWFEPSAKNNARIYAMSAGNGMYVSQDKGRNFIPLSQSGQPAPKTLKRGSFLSDGSFIAVDIIDRTVWKLVGNSWINLSQAYGLTRRKYADIAQNLSDGTLYLIDEGGKLQSSSNGGKSWWPIYRSSAAGPSDPPWLKVSDQAYFATSMMRFDPEIPGRLWVAAGTGVYHGDVAGAPLQLHLISQTRGIEELVMTDIVQSRGKAPLFSAWDFGIHLKNDLNIYSKSYGPKERVIIAAQQMDISHADPSFVVTNASDTRMNCCSQDGQSVLAGYSTDAGISWKRFETLPTPPGTKANDPWKMSFGSIAVAANNTNNIIWVPSFNRAPYFTKDRGKTWKRVAFPGEILPSTGSHSALHFMRKIIVADTVLPDTFYLMHSGHEPNRVLQGLWKTNNGGETWSQIFSGEIAPASDSAAKLRIVPGKAGHLFYTSSLVGGADTKLRRSIDGGISWIILQGIDHVDDIAFGKAAKNGSYPAIYISGQNGGRYGIWRSVDNAVHWQMIAQFPLGRLDQAVVIAADPDVFGRVYIGYMGSGAVYGEPANCTEPGVMDRNMSDCVVVK